MIDQHSNTNPTRERRATATRSPLLPRARFGLVFALAIALIQTAHAENWPGWRGPARSGVSSEIGVATHWSPTSGVIWKAPLPGSGISNPIVWEDRVICTSSDGNHQQDLHVICLDRKSGRELWHTKLWGTAPTLYHESKSSMASPSPVTDGRHVWAFFGSGDVFCLDMDGGLVWQRSLAAEYGEFENRFAASSSPLLFDDLLFVQCDHYGPSYLLAIDAATGANRWKVDRPEVWLSWSSPALVPVEGQTDPELVVSGSEKLDAYDPRSGEKLWTVRGLARECIPTPLSGNGLLYATSGPNNATYAIRPGGRGDVTESHVAWTATRGNPFVPSAILVGKYYYLVDDHGIATCLDAERGRSLWRKRLGGDFTASPVAAGGAIYFTNEAGQTVVLAANTEKYTELARNTIDEPVYASAAISQGCLFLRSAKQLWCIAGGQP